MKISPPWLREFVDIPAEDRALAEQLTHTGTAVESILQEHGQTLFEMEITTNRVDCMNHYGVARECSAIYDRELKSIAPKLPQPKAGEPFPVEIEDPGGCARFTAQIIRNVKISPSPAAIADRLHLLGASSISNAVDASNYTLIEMGHPTHAYDLDLLSGGKLIVRRARRGEALKTLDGVERKLAPEDVVIADAKKPVGLAGVTGGFDSMITERTKNILIEAAWFSPALVRATSRRLGMHTDASHRFERGADVNATSLACARVTELILQSASGELHAAQTDVLARLMERAPLRLRRSEILRILGQEISEAEISRILTRLGFALKKVKDGEWQVALPSWRLDVEREIDLLEEIARLYGYNNFKNSLPAFSGAVVEAPNATKQAFVRSKLLALGYSEAISTSFISSAEAREFAPHAQPAELANPLSEEAAAMRTSLVPGMLQMLAYNLNRDTRDVRLFELGNVFSLASGAALSEEKRQLAIGATGNVRSASVHEPARAYSYFDLKGAIEAVLAGFELPGLRCEGAAQSPSQSKAARAESHHYNLSQYCEVESAGRLIARFGELHPEIAVARKLKQEVYLAEIFLDALYGCDLHQPRYQPLSRYPAVERDFSFIFSEATRFAAIHGAVERLKLAQLVAFEPVDMLRSKMAARAGIPAGSYSLLLRARFQSHERTLRDDEVAAWSQQIISALEALGGKLRG